MTIDTTAIDNPAASDNPAKTPKRLSASTAPVAAPVEKPSATIRAKQPITRNLPAGYRLTPETIVTCNVDVQSVKLAGNKNWARAADYPKPGQPGRKVSDLGKVTRGDVLYDWQRVWVDLDPPPAPVKK